MNENYREWYQRVGWKVSCFLLIAGILCILIDMLTGCGKPLYLDEPEKLSATVAELQSRNKELGQQLQVIKEEKERLEDREQTANAQTTEFANKNYALEIENALLRQRNEEVMGQYNSLVSLYSQQSGQKDTASESLSEQIKLLQAEIDRIKPMLAKYENAVGAVDDKNVSELKTKLTGAEYTAFYKGWNIWKNKYLSK